MTRIERLKAAAAYQARAEAALSKLASEFAKARERAKRARAEVAAASAALSERRPAGLGPGI